MLEYLNIKMIFAKGYDPSWTEENFVIKKVKNTVSWTYVIGDLKGKDMFNGKDTTICSIAG